MKINNISASDPSFPARLHDIPARPKSLYIQGSLPDYRRGVAIVGTRKPTAYGKQVTAALAGRLSEKGAVIISGLAHGIDGIAHQATLEAGGRTLAVLPAGLDAIYPSAHRHLAKRILDTHGALISEYPPGTPPLQFRFLERNRIVSGLSDIVIVTEASLHSGTMNTVSHALEQGRDVYAVPGPITSAMSAGCNRLIAQGASPIVDVDAFVKELFPDSATLDVRATAHTDAEKVILELLAAGVSEGEELHIKSGLDAAAFSQTITLLEIRGAVQALGANRWGL